MMWRSIFAKSWPILSISPTKIIVDQTLVANELLGHGREAGAAEGKDELIASEVTPCPLLTSNGVKLFCTILVV
jgi:hypothetical protein